VKIRAGYDIAFQCPYAVPIVLMLTTHPSRDGDILGDQSMQFSPHVDARDYFDPYGNICTRLVALSETQSCWQLMSNRAMLLPHARGL
jgi:hypothetical protein